MIVAGIGGSTRTLTSILTECNVNQHIWNIYKSRFSLTKISLAFTFMVVTVMAILILVAINGSCDEFHTLLIGFNWYITNERLNLGLMSLLLWENAPLDGIFYFVIHQQRIWTVFLVCISIIHPRSITVN